MYDQQVISFDFKNEPLKLSVTPWTVGAVTKAVEAALARYPNMSVQGLTEYTTTSILYLGYFNYCDIDRATPVYDFEQFNRYVQIKMMTPETEQELIDILNQYTQIVQSWQQTK